MIAFNKSVRGFSHFNKDLVCQDSSNTLDMNDIASGCYIIAVADGHGDKTCVRSHIGSHCAVQSSTDIVGQFVYEGKGIEGGSYKMLLDKEKYTVKILTDTILFDWLRKIRKDYEETPLSQEEKENSGKYYESYRNGVDIEHAYGTTLLIALVTEEYLLLIHQGDGRCVVFWEDGSCEQPVKWDEKCEGNITTSLCDKNAAERIRHSFIPLEGKKPMAVLLFSDGVEDAYPDMDGVYAFLRDMMVNDMAEGTRDEIESRLGDTLSYYSEHGSGDDMSLAGVIDQDLIKANLDVLKKAKDDYMLNVKKYMLQNKLKSMEHKDSVLQRKAEEAEDEEQKMNYSNEYEEYHTEYLKVKAQLKDANLEEKECNNE